LSAGLTPPVGAVAAAVIGQDALDADAAGGEPRVRAVQERGCGRRGLVIVDLGVGQAGVVIDRGVDEAVADQWLVSGLSQLRSCPLLRSVWL
jgi:hypothetical protein